MFIGIIKDMDKVSDVAVEKGRKMVQFRHPMRETMIPIDG
jgi:hypothetical protein